MASAPRFDEATLQRHRSELLRVGRRLAKRLENLLAGQNVTLADLGLPGEDDHDKDEERLRNAVKRIDAALKRVQDGSYGACIECGTDLPGGVLETTPWQERCDGCDAPPPAP